MTITQTQSTHKLKKKIKALEYISCLVYLYLKKVNKLQLQKH